MKGAFRLQGLHHLARGTLVRVVAEHGENYQYEVEVAGLKGRWWIPIDAVQPRRRREVVRGSLGPTTGLRRRSPTARDDLQ